MQSHVVKALDRMMRIIARIDSLDTIDTVMQFTQGTLDYTLMRWVIGLLSPLY